MEAEGGNLRKIEDQEAEQISGGGEGGFPEAPRQNCPYCMKEWGGIVFMNCVGKWSMCNNGVWTSGYDYRCPSCDRKAQFEV